MKNLLTLILLAVSVALFGQSNQIPKEKIEVKKFQPKKTFSDFPISEKYSDKILPLDFSTCQDCKHFITRAKSAEKGGANFAGHFAFAEWGCGTSCQCALIIDLTTGKVYDAPCASGGYEYYLNSKLLVTNPPDSLGMYKLKDATSAPPQQYLWTGTSFNQLEQ